VLDTNVIVGQLLSKTRHSANARVYDLWLVRRELQLIVSPPIVDEYIELLERLAVEPSRIIRFHKRILTSPTVTHAALGKRFSVSRDADDDVLLATAQAGRARYLVTNDRDLLDISPVERGLFRFEIVRPWELLLALQSMDSRQ
jgi:putative PIN family toxin of toxin-antitoxin system